MWETMAFVKGGEANQRNTTSKHAGGKENRGNARWRTGWGRFPFDTATKKTPRG